MTFFVPKRRCEPLVLVSEYATIGQLQALREFDVWGVTETCACWKTLHLYSMLCKPIKSLVPVKWCENSFHCSSDQDWRVTILWRQHHDKPIFSSLLALKSDLRRWFHTSSGTSNIALECCYFLWILACTTWRWNSSLGINIWSPPFFAVSPWFQISFCQCLINQLWFIGFWSFFGHSALKKENYPFRNLKRN